ncbi:MAG: GIY-YIG nuclease family protein [Patescibacteria group bacterium]|nr:GIY-YIG nuclease family protein [Patescibacteria group bacterium]
MNPRRIFYVYIMASLSGTLYIGVTNDLERRVYEHKNDSVEGFTKKYQCHRLVYFEEMDNISDAVLREKQLKRWRRDKKEFLIKTLNPQWQDLWKN